MKDLFAIRAATTITTDSAEEVKQTSVEMAELVVTDNKLQLPDIVSVFFTITPDIKSFNPATAVRELLGWKDIVMICAQEAFIEGGLPLCIRSLFHVKSEVTKEIKHIYLNEAKKLRADWCIK